MKNFSIGLCLFFVFLISTVIVSQTSIVPGDVRGEPSRTFMPEDPFTFERISVYEYDNSDFSGPDRIQISFL